MNDVETTFERRPFVKEPAIWTDKNGLIHRAVGSEVRKGIRLLWAACGTMDIPANKAVFGCESEVTCSACVNALKESP